MASIQSGMKGNSPFIFSSVFSNGDCACPWWLAATVLQSAEHLLLLVRLMDAVSPSDSCIKSDPFEADRKET